MRTSSFLGCWCLILAAISTAILAATPKRSSHDQAPARAVDVFEGMASGELDVVLYQRDSTSGTITVKNKTDQPLTVKLPAAFAGVPILAQRRGGGGGGGNGGMGGGMGGMGGGMQSMGGGMMGGMGMMGRGGMGGGMGMGMGGMFNVGPEQVHKVKVATVCLDHGLADPSPRVPYKLAPIESHVKAPAIMELIKLMCAGRIDQHSAQAAVWHLQNGLSWEDLRRKVGIKHINGMTEPYFTAAQLELAIDATRAAEMLAEQSQRKNESGQSLGDVLEGKSANGH